MWVMPEHRSVIVGVDGHRVRGSSSPGIPQEETMKRRTVQDVMTKSR